MDFKYKRTHGTDFYSVLPNSDSKKIKIKIVHDCDSKNGKRED